MSPATFPLPAAAVRPDESRSRALLESIARTAFLDGLLPFARDALLAEVREDADLAPAGLAPERRHRSGGGTSTLYATDGVLAVVSRRGSWAHLFVVGADEATIDAIADAFLEAGVPPSDRPADIVDIGFWHLASHGGEYRRRALQAPAWNEVRRNYTAAVAAAVDGLMGWVPAADGPGGRLLLLHGPPGTGKTTLLRALARAWRTWCDADVVLDPDRLLDNVGYLTEAAFDPRAGEDSNAGSDRWRLLVLEDCDELVRADAKRGAGQALSRLLNATDGLVGQGTQLLVAMTTNEPLARLHPAVTRPGRCVAELEVGPLSRAEAVAWLGTSEGVGAGGATLAELYELRSGGTRFAVEDRAERVGAYL